MQQKINAGAPQTRLGIALNCFKGLAGLVNDAVARGIHKPKHIICHKKGPGLAKLFHHRATVMKTLYQRRIVPNRDGKILVHALFCYQGGTFFAGGTGRRVERGDIILVKLYLGKNPDEFYIQGTTQGMLPDEFHLHWQKRDRYGTITDISVMQES